MAKRGNGDATYRKRKDGRWEGRLMVGWKDDGSKDVKSRYGKTRKEAVEKIEKLKHELKIGKVIDADKINFASWTWHVYNIFKKDKVSSGTQELYEGVFTKHFEGSTIDIPLKNLTTRHIQVFLNNKGKTYAKETVKRMKTLIGWSIKKALQERIIVFNPLIGVSLPICNKRNEREVVPLSDRDIVRFNEYIKNSTKSYEIQVITIASILIKTGLRIGELLALNKSDIDFTNQTIKIYKSLRKGKNGFEIGEPKTDNSYRTVPFPVSLLHFFKNWDNQRKHQFMKWSDIWDIRNLYLCTDTGKPLDSRNVRRSFRRLLKRAGIDEPEKYCLYSLRHTAATKMWELGIDSAVASQILGHDITTMLKVYVSVGDKFKRSAIDKLDAAL